MLSQSLSKNFTQTDLFLNTDDHQLAYRRRKDEEKTSTSWGQRKLLLTLIQFISSFWDNDVVLKPIVVYAGAAPGTNILLVSQLFPEIEFHLYDPAQFKIKKSKKLHLYQQYFTNKDAKKWANRDDVYFISDIRTADYTKAKDLDDNERQIAKDMQMQMQWYEIIKPVYGQLKFRLPYTGGKRPANTDYLFGYIFKQPWAPQTTTETRLVPIPDSKNVSWSSQLYQDQMFYHNVIIRESYNYVYKLGQYPENEYLDYPELLNDWDSTAEAEIWSQYLIKRTGESSLEAIKNISRWATEKLTKKQKIKDNLEKLRSHPQAIKNRNFNKSRDYVGTRGDVKSRNMGTRGGVKSRNTMKSRNIGTRGGMKFTTPNTNSLAEKLGL